MAVPAEMTAAEAAALLPAGGRAFLAGSAAEPRAILNAVRDTPALWNRVTLTGALIPGVNDADFSGFGVQTRVETIFTGPGMQRPAGVVAHLPMHYSQFWQRLSRPGFVDTAYVTVPPPRGDGTVGLGLTADFVPAVLAGGARLVGIINPCMPDVRQGPRVPLARFTALVPDDSALPTYDTGVPGADLLRIAEHVIGLLQDGDTLQLGLGKVQSAVLARIGAAGLAGLGFHGGMISGSILPALTGGLFARGVTTGVALGAAPFYAALADMPGLVFAPVGHTHAAAVLAGLAQLVSVNSVIEIDLGGQANAETLGGRQMSGHGGLVDFHRGARAAPGGRAVLALASTAQGGTVSRIVPRLAEGTPVSVARADADIVVTEQGVARLGGLSLAERARALIAIADPAHRAALRAASQD